MGSFSNSLRFSTRSSTRKELLWEERRRGGEGEGKGEGRRGREKVRGEGGEGGEGGREERWRGGGGR